MQNTRLNSLVGRLGGQLGGWLRNPWRRLSVLIISVLFGNFFATAIATVSGQRARLDIILAGLLIILSEAISWITYRSRKGGTRSLLVESLNGFKIGTLYGLAVEAFKLGS